MELGHTEPVIMYVPPKKWDLNCQDLRSKRSFIRNQSSNVWFLFNIIFRKNKKGF
jgi:hypothetical protein